MLVDEHPEYYLNEFVEHLFFENWLFVPSLGSLESVEMPAQLFTILYGGLQTSWDHSLVTIPKANPIQ